MWTSHRFIAEESASNLSELGIDSLNHKLHFRSFNEIICAFIVLLVKSLSCLIAEEIEGCVHTILKTGGSTRGG